MAELRQVLDEFDVRFTMRRDGEYREFSLQIPANGLKGAELAVYQMASAINEGSDHLWKITDAIDIRQVRHAT